ncbi:DUF72 domain-containing protein [Actomonas aquatica]|uniref:DUF72 domain-containing protein n=1 Tax=Actomonas aquatica TaxID=2866162 RepID=A0ABZ1CDF4_9BACT|nr:DUF72 domain-containing protein [Opitutus sp. WL0086]WRQ89712.1 DUF72 domain-containing protein [Opitutus sp. WL0086]
MSEAGAAGAVSTRVRIGCPVWAHAPWRGTFFTREARREEFLGQYASVFATAEGNATFYGLPSEKTVARWAEEAPDWWRFAFKFPRVISHDRALLNCAGDTAAFFARLEPVAERCGPFFLQLHQNFGPERLELLRDYLAGLPSGFSYAVEVRNRAFFTNGKDETALDAMLCELGVDRVNFDTRPLFAAAVDREDDAAQEALSKKPRVPVRFTATGRRPFVRWVGDPQVVKNDAWLAEWVDVVARWVEEGREPYVFIHHADDLHAPPLARRFQAMLHARCPAAVPAPAVWPGEAEPGEDELPGAQLGLF